MRIIIFCIIFLLFNQYSSANEPLKFSSVIPENTHAFKIAKQLVKEISSRMNRDIVLLYYPVKRSIHLLERGFIHADLSRVASFQNLVPSAIRVEEYVTQIPYYAYSSMPDVFKVEGWNSLKPYSMVIVRGFQFSEHYLQHHKTHKIGSSLAAFKFLRAKRADIFVESSILAESTLRMDGFDTEGITRLEPPVDYLKSYTYFSHKYPKLAEQYASALISIKAEGILKKILNGTYKPD